MQARTVLNQLQEHLVVLFPPAPATKTGRPAIYLPRTPVFNSPDKALVGRWRKYLKWEESNPLEIEDKDKSQLHARIQSVYRKAIVRMRYFPEIWCVLISMNLCDTRQSTRIEMNRYMAYVWTNGLSSDQSLPENKRKEKRDEGMNLLKASVEANPSRYFSVFTSIICVTHSSNINVALSLTLHTQKRSKTLRILRRCTTRSRSSSTFFGKILRRSRQIKPSKKPIPQSAQILLNLSILMA